MKSIQKSIEVDLPLAECFQAWSRFEEFPLFMEGVEQVQRKGEKSLHWVAEIGGKRVEYDAEITMYEPNRCIAWRSTSGAANAGRVDFREIGGRCRIDLSIEYEPEGATEEIGSALGVVSARVEGDLRRFKEYVEGRLEKTGAGRRTSRDASRHGVTTPTETRKNY